MAGNIETAETIDRLSKVKEMQDKGMNQKQIAEEMNLSTTTINRYIKQLDQVSLNGLTTEIVCAKRVEVEEELNEAIKEAKEMYFHFKKGVPKIVKGEKLKDGDGNVILFKDGYVIEKMHKRWTDSLGQKAKLYGLDSAPEIVSPTFSQTNINEQHNYSQKEKDKVKKEIFSDYESAFTEQK